MFYRNLITSFLILFSAQANASFIYSYTGNPFTYAGNTDPSQLAYSSESFIEFSFVTNEKLQFGASYAAPAIWKFSDGTQSFSSLDGILFDQFIVSVSNDLTKIFDSWYIDITPEQFLYVETIQTRFEGPGLTGDWGQNKLYNYGGNSDSPGQWTITTNMVPAPPAITLMGLGLAILFGLKYRKAQT